MFLLPSCLKFSSENKEGDELNKLDSSVSPPVGTRIEIFFGYREDEVGGANTRKALSGILRIVIGYGWMQINVRD